MISTAQAAVVKKAPVKYSLETTGISMYLSNKKIKLVRVAIESCRHDVNHACGNSPTHYIWRCIAISNTTTTSKVHYYCLN